MLIKLLGNHNPMLEDIDYDTVFFASPMANGVTVKVEKLIAAGGSLELGDYYCIHFYNTVLQCPEYVVVDE